MKVPKRKRRLPIHPGGYWDDDERDDGAWEKSQGLRRVCKTVIQVNGGSKKKSYPCSSVFIRG